MKNDQFLKKFNQSEQVGDGFFQLDQHWIFTRVNKVLERELKLSREEILGRQFQEIFPQRNFEKYESVMVERVPETFIDHNPERDTWTEVNAYPEDDGGMAVFYHDLTPQIRAENKTKLNEERLNAIFQYSTLGINLFDLDGRFLDANPAFCKMTGYPVEDLRNLHKSDLTFQKDLDKSKSLFERLVRGELPSYQIEKRYTRKDGTWFWAQSTLSSIRNISDEVSSIVALTEDITDRRRLEREVHNERENFRNLFRQTPEMVCILIGPEHRFEFVNEAHIKALGFDATGMTVREAQPESVQIHGILDEVYRTGETALLKEIAVDVGTSLRYFDLTYAARANDLGVIDGVMILGTEITDMVIGRDKLKAAVSARTEFLSVASHELRTPLTSLKLQAQSMRRNYASGKADAFSPEKIKKLVEINERQIGRLTRLVDDMLDFSRIESGKLTYRKVEGDLSKNLQEVFEGLKEQLDNAHCETSVAFESNIRGVFDFPRIEQVLTNLLTNAMRYGKGRPVGISLTKKNHEAILRVKDSGPGIEVADQQKIFKRFERLVNPSEVSGLGLGLFISQEIVEAHGGTIRIESKMGEGSEFIVSLPLGGHTK
jgi:PAS domain S-box-containing protein